jgi:hypothetical protein
MVLVEMAFPPPKIITVSVVAPLKPDNVRPVKVGDADVLKSCGLTRLIVLRVPLKLELKLNPEILDVLKTRVSVAVWNENPPSDPEIAKVESTVTPVNPAPEPIKDPEKEPDIITPTAPVVLRT